MLTAKHDSKPSLCYTTRKGLCALEWILPVIISIINSWPFSDLFLLRILILFICSSFTINLKSPSSYMLSLMEYADICMPLTCSRYIFWPSWNILTYLRMNRLFVYLNISSFILLPLDSNFPPPQFFKDTISFPLNSCVFNNKY